MKNKLCILALLISLCCFSSCSVLVLSAINNTFNGSDDVAENIEADIKILKNGSGKIVTVTPKDKVAFAYTIFSVSQNEITQLNTKKAESLYHLDNGKAVPDPLRSATFEVPARGTYYVAVEVLDKIVLDSETGEVSVYTRTMFTELINVKR